MEGQDTRSRNPKRTKEILEKTAEELRVAAAEEQPVQRIPGETVRGNKVNWTRRDLKAYPVVQFTPPETVAGFLWNGLSFDFLVDEEREYPEPIVAAYKVWRERKRRRRTFTETGLSTSPIGIGSLEPFETTQPAIPATPV